MEDGESREKTVFSGEPVGKVYLEICPARRETLLFANLFSRTLYGDVSRKKALPGAGVMAALFVAVLTGYQVWPMAELCEFVCACRWATMLLGQVRMRLELVCSIAMRNGAVVL